VAKEKKYINMCKIKEKKFDNGGSVLNASFNVKELEKLSNVDGWVNITICERREESEKGATHYAYHNDFQPNGSGSSLRKDEDDDLPF